MSLNFVKLILRCPRHAYTIFKIGTSYIRKALELLKINLGNNEGLIEGLYYKGSESRMQ